MPTTSRNLRFPASSAAPNVPQDIQNLATDVTEQLPKQWVNYYTSPTNYIFGPVNNNVWEPIPGPALNPVTVPVGRVMHLEYKAPICLSDGGFMYVRMVVNGVEVDTQGISAGWGPVRLTYRHNGTGGTVGMQIQAQRTAGTGDIRAAAGAPCRAGYQII